MQATANARGTRIAGQLLTGRAVEKRRNSHSDAGPSTCISSRVAPSSSSIARCKLNEAEAIRRAAINSCLSTSTVSIAGECMRCVCAWRGTRPKQKI